jgi:hypothetical protein
MELESLPYLEASLEDFHEGMRRSMEADANRRHSVLLLEEAFEFLLYQKLVLLDVDIYRTGQYTIGINKAIELVQEKGIVLLFMNAIRRVQKLRGDAKHHGQVPSEKDYVNVLEKVRVSYAAFVFENFWEDLGDGVFGVQLVPYDEALYVHSEYVKAHQPERACRHMVAACVHKMKALLDDKSLIATWRMADHHDLLRVLRGMTQKAETIRTPIDIEGSVAGALDALEQHLHNSDWAAAHRISRDAYGLVAKIVPSGFQLDTTNRLTQNLVGTPLPHGVTHWTSLQATDTDQFRSIQESTSALLEQLSEVASVLGTPSAEEVFDGDTVHMWDLAVFDGYRWHPLILTDQSHLPIMPESGDSDDPVTSTRRESVAKAVLNELREVMAQSLRA